MIGGGGCGEAGGSTTGPGGISGGVAGGVAGGSGGPGGMGGWPGGPGGLGVDMPDKRGPALIVQILGLQRETLLRKQSDDPAGNKAVAKHRQDEA